MTRSTLLLAFALLAAPAFAGPSEIEEIRDFLDREMMRTVDARLDAFLAASPDSAEGRALLAEVLLRDENWDGAEAAARRAVEIDAKNAGFWILWGRARFEQGRQAAEDEKPEKEVRGLFAQAEVGFRRAQGLDPEHPDPLWWIGWAKEWQGQGDSGRQFYDAQIREFPEHPGGYRRLGHSLGNRAGQANDEDPEATRTLRREALAVFDEGLEKAGDDAELLYLRANTLEADGSKQAALESLKRSVLADPAFERSWNLLRKRLDEADELVPFAKEVLKRHPTASFPAWLVGYHAMRAMGESARERCERALGIVLPALERNGDHEDLMKIAFRAAQALIGSKRSPGANMPLALEAFGRIHDAYAWSGDAANNLGFFFREAPDYAKSLEWYLKACERAPENQDILNDTGLMYLFHFPKLKEKGLPYFLKTVALVRVGEQDPERGYWDALENLCKHYWEVDRRPEKVVEYARLRYLTTKGVEPYNTSQVSERYAKKARRALRK